MLFFVVVVIVVACRDCNGAQQTGFMLPQATIRRAARCSTAKVNLSVVFFWVVINLESLPR